MTMTMAQKMVDPMYALWQTYFGGSNPAYSKSPVVGGQPYDFSLDPLNMYQITDDDGKKDGQDDQDKSGNSYSGGDSSGGVTDGRDTPYGWQSDYYGTNGWTPSFGLGDYAKELGYGLALGKTMGKNLIGNIFGTNPLSNPLSDPANQTAIEQMGKQYGFDPDMMKTAIANVYAGRDNSSSSRKGGLLDSILGGLGSITGNVLNGTTDSAINATDTLRGMLGMMGDKWGNYDWGDYTQYDPTSPDRVSWGSLDPYKAAQFMDSWNDRMGSTGKGMAYDADLEQYTDLAKNEPYSGFRSMYLDMLGRGSGPSVSNGGLTGRTVSDAYANSGLKDFVSQPISDWDVDTFNSRLNDYKKQKSNPSRSSDDDGMDGRDNYGGDWGSDDRNPSGDQIGQGR